MVIHLSFSLLSWRRLTMNSTHVWLLGHIAFYTFPPFLLFEVCRSRYLDIMPRFNLPNLSFATAFEY